MVYKNSTRSLSIKVAQYSLLPGWLFFSAPEKVVREALFNLQFLKYSFVLQDPEFAFLISVFVVQFPERELLYSFGLSSPHSFLRPPLRIPSPRPSQ